MNKLKTIILLGMLPIFLLAKDQTKEKSNMEVDMLRDAGAVTYTVLPDNTYIGFSSDKKPVVATKSTTFKSYTVITMYVAVKKDGDNFIISDAEIKDIHKIKDKGKLNNVTNAINDIKGAKIASAKNEYKNIDAVTGATRYHASIYLQGNLLAKELLAQLQKNPKPGASIAIPVKEKKDGQTGKKLKM